MADLDSLIAEGLHTPTDGWDFNRLGNRLSVDPPPWDYGHLVAQHARSARTMLDMDTGGGEWLAHFAARPPLTCATESWPANVAVAGRRLRPLGVAVVQTEAAPDNEKQHRDEPRGRLPFRSAVFDLVANRHASFNAGEIARVLRPGAVFVSQQVDSGSYADLYDVLDLPRPAPGRWNVPVARQQLTRAGLVVMESGTGTEVTTFADVGALVWYLRQVPWSVDSADIAMDRTRLGTAARRMPVRLRQSMFWLVASRAIR